MYMRIDFKFLIDVEHTTVFWKEIRIHVIIVDPSMDILYEDGKGSVFKESLSWLQSASEHLRMSGALAIGNFARNGKSSVSTFGHL